MIVTQNEARKIIKQAYGEDFKFKLTTRTTLGVRPVYQTTMGMHTLAWRKLASGKDSAVALGHLLPGGAIDWERI